ncbi:MAG TPA: TIM barrel protein [Sumerlaeia bacterium]|nr:TIM barrel protein [Sumerlaeia bacterium]
MRFGLVTYLWGQDWDLPTLIANCEEAKVRGVELRTAHKHGVEPHIDARSRKDVKKRFTDSPVVLVGLGSNECFDSPDPAGLEKSIEATKAFVRLSHDVGGSGVKVKPNSFHKGVAREKTIEQIGKSLNVVGAYGADYGQEIRLEAHGACGHLPDIKQIMDVADHPNVGVCWNCNAEDLEGEGLAHNFGLVRDRFGATAHVRELDKGDYPYQDLMALFVETDYAGWILLEARHPIPTDRVSALIRQRETWETMLAAAQATR